MSFFIHPMAPPHPPEDPSVSAVVHRGPPMAPGAVCDGFAVGFCDGFFV